MRCVVGIDLGSTTTKAVLLGEDGRIVGRGITNSRSSYDVASAVARAEALTDARFSLLEVAVRRLAESRAAGAADLAEALRAHFRLELHREQLAALRAELEGLAALPVMERWQPGLDAALGEILAAVERRAPELFRPGAERRSDFFRDLAGAAYMAEAERLGGDGGAPFEVLLHLYDRAILSVETRPERPRFDDLLRRAAREVAASSGEVSEVPVRPLLERLVADTVAETIEEAAFVGTGYGRQRLPFPKEAIRSEILCHGRGAHRLFPGTRTVLDIGGQDTKAIQVDDQGVVTAFQMNDRCAAGCGRYLGYIADELNLGVHELGPLALQARRAVRVNSTCTVFAGTELRERLALGESREDVLAGLHRAMMLRAMSLLARSGGVRNEFTFTGGVCRNPMANRILGELVHTHYGDGVVMNTHPDSIYMGAIGAALFARDALEAGRPAALPAGVSLPATATAEVPA